MDLVSLDDNFQPSALVESYETLNWAERYFKYGDFELVASDIPATMAALPLGSWVSLLDSTVPMLVETYELKKPIRSSPQIRVLGRTFETVLERRASVNELPAATGRTAWMMSAAKPSDAAYKAMRVVLGDIARSQDGAEVLASLSPAVSPLDAIPDLTLTLPNDYSPLTPENYEIKPQDLYTTVMQLLKLNNRGLKSVRPGPNSSQIAVEIYNGADLTNELVFDARFDQYDDTTYLLSEVGSANVAYFYGSGGSSSVLKTAAAEPSGLERRVIAVDQSSDATTESADVRRTRGLIELYKYNATALFDGEVAQQVAEGYNRDYFLGDILKLTGEYGLSQNVRVAEFIRTADSSGVKAFPAFEAVD